MGKLSAKQQRFVEEYLVDLNATQAAIRAGYSQRTANQIAAENLAKPGIAAAIQKARDALSKKTEWTQERVISQLEPIAESDLSQLFDVDGDRFILRRPSDIPKIALKAIASIKVRRCVEGTGETAQPVEVIEFKFWDKQTALDQITRHFGWYKPTKVAPTTPDGSEPWAHLTVEEKRDRIVDLLGSAKERKEKSAPRRRRKTG